MLLNRGNQTLNPCQAQSGGLQDECVGQNSLKHLKHHVRGCQGVSAEPSSTQPPAVLHPACHVRRFLHSTALQPDHRMCSGSGVMRTGLLVQTRQGWRPRPPRTHGKCKYVSQ
ncbi:hypothetical protein NQZ68_034194 [Dissostichus eleginoides]|nr:hypothetical protein NQZ68_034194 [Dissostichus eleginoides]